MTPDEIVNEANRLTELGGQLKTLAKWRATCAQFSHPVDCVINELHIAGSAIAKDALRAEVAQWFADGLAAWEARVCGEMRVIARGMSAGEEKPLELSRGDVRPKPWARFLTILPKEAGEIWVRWTGADGIYRWLHPVDSWWVEEPDQINMPLFFSYDAARKAADESPEPPTWKEFEKRNEQNEE